MYKIFLWLVQHHTLTLAQFGSYNSVRYGVRAMKIVKLAEKSRGPKTKTYFQESLKIHLNT